MAAMIGRGKSWFWWLAGFLCALAFGSKAESAEAVALYGVRPVNPGGVDQPVVNPEQQKKAEGLVADYLAPVAAAEPAAEAKAAIEKLIADFASNDAKTRDAASAAALKQGPAALALLRAAFDSKDAEVAERARAAATAIEAAARAPKIEELKKLGFVAQNVVNQKWAEANQAAVAADKTAAETEKSGDAAAAAKTRAEAKALRERAGMLAALLRQVSPEVMQARYMARPMVPLD
jgi:hypothetical protein